MCPDKLSRYRSKRDFSKTSEPPGAQPSQAGNVFVVHKHHASSDHYDLRLQVGDVLKSWAVPKGPSLDPRDKRLAVETEDHPLDYADFEGVIPQGEYGGGPMIVWDRGTWAPMADIEDSLESGDFKFRLWGEKLKGGWMLARLKPKPGDEKPAWLLFKEHDQAARPGSDILGERPESAKSGRLIEDLVRPAPTLVAAELEGARTAAFPAGLEPQLATAAAAPPRDDGWLHEIKLDGYRTMAYVEAGRCRMITRGGLDWTKRYADLSPALAALPCRAAVIDGEVVVLDDKGVSRFAALQDALSVGAAGRLTFCAFDLLHLDGVDLRGVALIERKALLRQLLAAGGSPAALQFGDHFEGEGEALYERASELGLEGIVSKKASAPYQPGRSTSWLKIKARQFGDFVIAGFIRSAATGGGLASLALAEWEDGELRYRGKVGSGFDAADLATLLARLESMTEGGAPLDGAPRDVIWVRPSLTARVFYANRTADNLLRHAVFRGLREAELSTRAAAVTPRLITDADLASISITNPERRLFGRSGPTKLDIAVYYAAVGDYLLPHLFDRPVSLVRCPTPKPADCFFQRHAFTGMPATVETFSTQNSDGETKTYLTVEDVRGYLALAQFGVVEFHTWGTHRRHLDKPDRIVLDLDPGEGIGWREVVEAAIHIKAELEALGLAPFVKTSGGKGLHVVLPIRPRLGWKPFHAASSALASRLAASAPEAFTTVMGAENRKRRIFIDFHRNARSATAVAAYSLRARPGLPASTPLAWQDLESIDSPQDLNYSSLPRLLTTSGDAWGGINESATDLPANLRAQS